MKTCFLFLLCLFYLATGRVANACMGPSSETTTFLEQLPEKAMEKDVVAKIEVLSNKTEKISTKLGKKVVESDSKIVADVKVVEAIKGVEKGSIIKVVINLSSCSREPQLAQSQKYYLAGSIGKDGIFRGEWRLDSANSK